MKKTYFPKSHYYKTAMEYIEEIEESSDLPAERKISLNFKDGNIQTSITLTEENAYDLIAELAAKVSSAVRAEKALIRGRKAFHGVD